MHAKFLTALLAFGASSLAHVLPDSLSSRKITTRRCGRLETSERHLNQSLELSRVETAKIASDKKAFDFDVEVDVYVHVVSSSRSKFIKKKQIKNQIKYLNKVYNPYDVYFNHVSTDFHVNGNWSVAGAGEYAMKKKLRKGSYKDLNLYYLDKVEDDETLGICPFPEPDVEEGDETFILDGCMVVAETVPGGTVESFNLGGTTAHEVGHWFNLIHTFEGGCEGGDEVWDTPVQKSPSEGCPKLRDSCPGKPGIDPIHNFMDYSDDECLEGFTLGQRRRMHSSWQTYRAKE